MRLSPCGHNSSGDTLSSLFRSFTHVLLCSAGLYTGWTYAWPLSCIARKHIPIVFILTYTPLPPTQLVGTSFSFHLFSFCSDACRAAHEHSAGAQTPLRHGRSYYPQLGTPVLSRELPIVYRGHLHTLRPVGHLWMNNSDLRSWHGPFSEIPQGHSLLSSSLLLLLRLLREPALESNWYSSNTSLKKTDFPLTVGISCRQLLG